MTQTRIDARAIIESVRDGQVVSHENASLLIEDGKVSEIGDTAALARRYPGVPAIGGPRFVAMPGLVNAHHHVGLTPLRLGAPDLALEVWIPHLLGLRDVDPYLDTLFSAFEMIRSGVTTVNHLPIHTAGGVEDIAATSAEIMRAYDDVGMRAAYSVTFRDQNRIVYEADEDLVARAPDDLKPLLRQHFAQFKLNVEGQVEAFDAVRARAPRDGKGRVQVQIAPANLHWLSDHALSVVRDLSRKHALPMHMHLLETRYQRDYATRRTGKSAVRHLHDEGLTGPGLTLGHGVWMSDEDIAICAETGTHVCHNCSSNMRLKSGLAPVKRLVSAGVPVCLGLDEAGINDDRDMLQEMRLVLQAHREPGIDTPELSAADVLGMATAGGAGTVAFGSAIGSLSPGARADCVLIDWDAVTHPWHSEDVPLVDVLVRRARADHVHTVMVDGEVIFADRRFTRVDENEVLGEIGRRMRLPLTPAEEQRRTMSRKLIPVVRDLYANW